MITVEHVHYEIHDELSKNDKVHNSFIKKCYYIYIGSKSKVTQILWLKGQKLSFF